MVANFRSYEGQLRLLTAVVAAHPELKLNYKETAKHYGSDWTESGIEHFFRPIKKNSKAIQDLVRRGEDARNFTPKAGREPAPPGTGTGAGAGSTTPKTPRTTGGRKRAAPSTGKSTASKKARQQQPQPEGAAARKAAAEGLGAGLDDDDSDNEFAPLDMTPTKPRINEQKLREYQQAQGWLPADPPALEPAQAAATPDDDDDVKIVTPADAGPSFSFAQGTWPSSGVGGVGAVSGWDAGALPSGGSYVSGEAQKGVEFEEDDLAGEC